jgi:hypothetical protein
MSRQRSGQDFVRGLRGDPALRKALRAAGRAVAVEAEAAMGQPHAPVRVVDHGDAVRVVNTSPDAVLEEWGSARQEPIAPLRRGVHAAGLRLDETH